MNIAGREQVRPRGGALVRVRREGGKSDVREAVNGFWPGLGALTAGVQHLNLGRCQKKAME